MESKKIAAVFLTFIMVIGLMTGCGASNEKKLDSNNDNRTSSVKETESDFENITDTTENTSTGNGKTLVVYYSATGTTAGVAQTIANATGGDLFEIQPVEPYTDDDLNWRNDDSRVSREHDDESLRDVDLVSTSVDNWDSYDTVFIGYPIWWGIAAWPVDGFVEANDFTGKTVIPFCTAASSSIGDSGNLLEELAGTGNWIEGKRLDRGISEDEAKDWINDLGISSTEN